jgi:hypothetical protein
MLRKRIVITYLTKKRPWYIPRRARTEAVFIIIYYYVIFEAMDRKWREMPGYMTLSNLYKVCTCRKRIK